MKGERVWRLLAMLLAAWAVAASLHTLLSASRHREILDRMEADFRLIQGQAGRWAREDALREALEERQAWKPADLDDLAGRLFGEGIAKVALRPAVPAADGWQMREASVGLREIPYARAVDFLSAAAENPPAWRLREIDIQPSAEAGTGSMNVVLEALEKKRP